MGSEISRTIGSAPRAPRTRPPGGTSSAERASPVSAPKTAAPMGPVKRSSSPARSRRGSTSESVRDEGAAAARPRSQRTVPSRPSDAIAPSAATWTRSRSTRSATCLPFPSQSVVTNSGARPRSKPAITRSPSRRAATTRSPPQEAAPSIVSRPDPLRSRPSSTSRTTAPLERPRTRTRLARTATTCSSSTEIGPGSAFGKVLLQRRRPVVTSSAETEVASFRKRASSPAHECGAPPFLCQERMSGRAGAVSGFGGVKRRAVSRRAVRAARSSGDAVSRARLQAWRAATSAPDSR